jgi:protein involved in polysaccharide export with SLBB domain
MTKSVVRIALLLALVSVVPSLYGQSEEEARRMYDEYLQLKATKASASPSSYRSPEISGDDPIEYKQPVESDTSLYAERLTFGDSAVSVDTLMLFGYNMFIDRSAQFASPEISAVPPDYTIGPGDNLIVNLWGRVDMEYSLTVNREGRIFVPKVGEIVCNGSTIDELEQRLSQRLSESYSDFKLGVSIGKIRSIKVYVYGEVKQPGGYTLTSLSTMFNALYACQGPNERGSMRKVRLIRGGRTLLEVDLYAFLLNGDTSGDVKLESEDVVFVPLAGELAWVRGEVRRPAIYELRGGETVHEVIALAGGTKPSAFKSRILVDRVGETDGRIVADVDLRDPSDSIMMMTMKGGDDITVFPMDNLRHNAVWLAGYVKHPAAYQIEERQRVSDLIFDGDQLYEDSYLQRADLIRTLPGGVQEILPVNLEALLSGDTLANIELKAKDSLVVYSTDEVSRAKFVDIRGEVTNPGSYRLFENMRLSDLVFRSGNLKRNAYLLLAEIVRINEHGTVDIITVDLSRLSDLRGSTDIILQEDDQVFIRRLPDWESDRLVKIEGQVVLPGDYALAFKGETLYDILQRAGGLKENAFTSGAMLFRSQISSDLKRKNIREVVVNSSPLRADSTGRLHPDLVFDFDPDKLTRIVIDLETIIESQGQNGDIELRAGDQIYIPPMPAGVQVLGAVASTGTIQFQEGKKPSFYLDRAGGLLESSDKNSIRVVKANGRVLTWQKARGRKIELGDALVVPTEVKHERDWWKILGNAATIMGGLATTVYIVDRL